VRVIAGLGAAIHRIAKGWMRGAWASEAAPFFERRWASETTPFFERLGPRMTRLDYRRLC